MKIILRIFVLLAVVTTFFSCVEKEIVITPKLPGEVALQFFNSISNGDVETLRECVFFDDPSEQTVFDEYLERLFIPDTAKMCRGVYDAKYTLLSEKTEGDTAFVELKGVTVFGKSAKMKLRLFNIEGAWKVDGSQAVLHRVV